ncbi:MAG: hypothetical protein ACOYMJ_05055 [Candidatus Methylopumilus universalis]
MKNIHVLPNHIYITSDEKIISSKDWFIDIKDKRNHLHQVGYGLDSYEWTEQYDLQYYKKIILTTDPKLIADGVQAIDDSFLEWFVENPSCESVEVRYEVLRPFQSVDKGYTIHLPDNEVLGEPKQEQQTAVEWYREEMESIEYRFRSREINFEKLRSLTKDAFEKAKALEKEHRLNQNKTELNDALREFQKKYPSVTSGDLQTFILGWQAAQSNPI